MLSIAPSSKSLAGIKSFPGAVRRPRCASRHNRSSSPSRISPRMRRLWNDLEAATRHHWRNSGAIYISASDGRNSNRRHDELPIRRQQDIGVGQPSDLWPNTSRRTGVILSTKAVRIGILDAFTRLSWASRVAAPLPSSWLVSTASHRCILRRPSLPSRSARRALRPTIDMRHGRVERADGTGITPTGLIPTGIIPTVRYPRVARGPRQSQARPAAAPRSAAERLAWPTMVRPEKPTHTHRRTSQNPNAPRSPPWPASPSAAPPDTDDRDVVRSAVHRQGHGEPG